MPPPARYQPVAMEFDAGPAVDVARVGECYLREGVLANLVPIDRVRLLKTGEIRLHSVSTRKIGGVLGEGDRLRAVLEFPAS